MSWIEVSNKGRVVHRNRPQEVSGSIARKQDSNQKNANVEEIRIVRNMIYSNF